MERAELLEKFGSALTGKESLITLALSLMKLHNLTAESLSDHWEAYILPRLAGPPSGVVFNEENLSELGRGIAAQLRSGEKALEEGVKVKGAGMHKILNKGGLDSIYGLATPIKGSRSSIASLNSSSPHSALATPYSRPNPALSKLKSSPADSPKSSPPASTSTPFHLRPKSAPAGAPLNGHLDLSVPPPSTTSRISLASAADPNRYKYRYMYERMMERSEVLDNAIDEAAEVFKHNYGIEELGDPSVQSQEDIIAVGRICSETDGIKPSLTSTWLESSRTLGAGSRVLLKFDDKIALRGAPRGCGGIGLFAGELVAVKGRNGGGSAFTVSEILMMPPINPTYTRPSDLLDYQYGIGAKKLAGGPLSVVVAAGPYTVERDLDFAPLAALVESIGKERPDLVILTGPFIDSNHPMIKAGQVDMLPNDLFCDKISRQLARLLKESPSTTVILIPNARDMISQHITYPQSPFNREAELRLPKGVKLLPNPAVFSVNEVVFAITSVDVLFHLQSQQFFKPCLDPVDTASDDSLLDPNAKDALSRGCRHILRQRSFYPLFPAPHGNGIDPLNLDVTHNDLVKLSDDGPDIVILPSILKHFAKVVDSTVIVNPSFLTRGSSGGTYARMTIHPLQRTELERRINEGAIVEGEEAGEADEQIEHRLFERCRVDLIKV